MHSQISRVSLLPKPLPTSIYGHSSHSLVPLCLPPASVPTADTPLSPSASFVAIVDFPMALQGHSTLTRREHGCVCVWG